MRFDLSDEEWAVLEPLMPTARKTARADDRTIMNAIFYVLRTGMPWRDLPERYGPYMAAVYSVNLARDHDRPLLCPACARGASLASIDPTLSRHIKDLQGASPAGRRGRDPDAGGRQAGDDRPADRADDRNRIYKVLKVFTQ